MWHFNALFQPAKCLLICKTRSRFELLFHCVSPTFALPVSLSFFSFLSFLSSSFPVAVTVWSSRSAISSSSSSLFSGFCFWYPLPSIGSRGPDFRVALLPLFLRRLSRFFYLLKAAPSFCGTSLGIGRGCTEHFSLLLLARDHPVETIRRSNEDQFSFRIIQ